MNESEGHSVVSDSLWHHGLYSPWNSPGQNTGEGSLSLLQGTFPTQGSNPGLPHCRQILYQLSHKGSPRILEWVVYPFSSGSSQSRNQTGASCVAGRFYTNWAIRKWMNESLYNKELVRTMYAVQKVMRTCRRWLKIFNLSFFLTLFLHKINLFSSVQWLSVSDSLRPHEPQHATPPCPSPTPRVHANPCPSSWWCHPAISSSVIPFSSCPRSFPASGSFQMSQLFSSGGQSIGVSASTSVPPMNTPMISFRMDWLDLLAVQGTPKSLLQHHSSKASILWCSAFLIVQLSHPYMTTGKTIALTRWNLVGKVMSLLFNMLSN